MSNELATGLVFLGYMGGVFLLAILSHRLFSKKSFLAEYFLGSRGLGVWALAFSFAATSASGGSFTGYPSLIYRHGWVLAFWIASYMVMPIVTMGLLGKRLNQIGRRANAITIPDVLRARYDSKGLALFATLAIVFFTIVNLIAQFKAGGVILNVLLEGTPGYTQTIVPLFEWIPQNIPILETTPAGYIVGLLLFSVIVVVYTAYGGFRAVVWTDVLQGVVMGVGVLLLIPYTLRFAGGLEAVTRTLNERPARAVSGLLTDNNVLEYQAAREDSPRLFVEHIPGDRLEVELSDDDELAGKLITVYIPLGSDGKPNASANEVRAAIQATSEAANLVSVTVPPLPKRGHNGRPAANQPARNNGQGAVKLTQTPLFLSPGSDMVFGPGRTLGGGATEGGMPFHPLAMGISFFFMWAISGAGQPGTMVRLMAFDNSKTLRRAIFTVTIYFGCIYLPMVFIFVSAQQIIHPAELTSGTDQIMPQLAKTVAPWWFAGILIAAPFAAVMSTVDSFLLMISSSLVRDIYQQTINPSISERTTKIASYATTATVGTLVAVLALNPPEMLQYIIVFCGAGFAATFLAVVFFGLYWKGMTKAGAWAAMVGGFATIVFMFTAGLLLNALGFDVETQRWNLLGLHPIVVSLAASFGAGIVVSLMTPKLPDHVIRRFFAKSEQAGTDV